MPTNSPFGGALHPLRIGEGWDTHALVPGRPLILGGVHIPYHQGLLGHSDADVLCHALIDALLGAACLGDIGRMFPDHQASFKDANSVDLLKQALQRVRQVGWQIANVDCTVVAQSPKLAPFMAPIAQTVAKALGVVPEQVNIKAKTAEHLGPVGNGQSIEARAVVLLYADSGATA